MKKPKKATKQPKKAMRVKNPKFNRKEYMRNYHVQRMAKRDAAVKAIMDALRD